MIQTYHLILTCGQFNQQEKNKLSFSGFSYSNEPRSGNKRKPKDRQVPGSCLRAENLWNIKLMVILIVIGVIGRSSNPYKRECGNGRSEELRPCRQQHCWDRPEYWEESWKPEETYCRSDSNERPPVNADVENSQGVGTITKGLLKGQEDLEVGGRVETIQMTTLLRTARMLRRVLETWGDLLSLKLQWKTIS